MDLIGWFGAVAELEGALVEDGGGGRLSVLFPDHLQRCLQVGEMESFGMEERDSDIGRLLHDGNPVIAGMGNDLMTALPQAFSRSAISAAADPAPSAGAGTKGTLSLIKKMVHRQAMQLFPEFLRSAEPPTLTTGSETQSGAHFYIMFIMMRNMRETAHR
jgi:hypothetical protein